MFCCCRVLVHTQLLVTFISMLVLNTYVFIMQDVYAGCYDVFICIRGDDLGDERVGTSHIIVGLDTLHVLGRVVFVLELDVNTCWCICVLDDCLQLEILLVYSMMKNVYVHFLFMQVIIY